MTYQPRAVSGERQPLVIDWGSRASQLGMYRYLPCAANKSNVLQQPHICGQLLHRLLLAAGRIGLAWQERKGES